MNPLDIIVRYYPEEAERTHILLSHSRDVAQLALEICREHPELNADESFVYEAAMLHDIGVFLTNAPGIDCYGDAAYIMHGYLGAELLRRDFSLERHALVAERHTGAGLTSEDIEAMGLALPEGIYAPQSVEERIICYADKFYSKTRLGQRASLERVRKSMSRFGDSALERFALLHAELGIDGLY